MKSLTFLHDKTSQNQRERNEDTKHSLIPPMAGGREPNVSRVSEKRKKKLKEGSVESSSKVAWYFWKYPLQVHV